MKNKFDDLAKGMAQSVTRRQALKKFGAGIALTCFGLANIAKAAKTCAGTGEHCNHDNDCCSGNCLTYGGRGGGGYFGGHSKKIKFCA